MGRKRPRNRRTRRSAVCQRQSPEEMQWSVRVLDAHERSAAEAELAEPTRCFEVVGVDRGRGLWVRDTGSLGAGSPSPEAPPGGDILAFVEDPECSMLFDCGDLFTGTWRNGRATMSGVLRKSLLFAAVDR